MDTNQEPGVRRDAAERGQALPVRRRVAREPIDGDRIILDGLEERGLIDSSTKPYVRKSKRLNEAAAKVNFFAKKHPEITEAEFSELFYGYYLLLSELMDAENRVDNR